jgi:hypothetical protein
MMTKEPKTNRAAEYIVRCIGEVQADGHQTWEDHTGEVPDGLVPDDWGYNVAGLWMRFGEETYRVKVSRVRQRASGGPV